MQWLIRSLFTPWWPLNREARAVLAEFGITTPSDLDDPPAALAYAFRQRCPEQMETLREIASIYPIRFYL